MKNLFKKGLSVLLFIVLSAFLAACGSDEAENQAIENEQTEEVEQQEQLQEEEQQEVSKEEEVVKTPIEIIQEKNYVMSVELDEDGVLNVEIDERSPLTVNFIIDRATDILEDMNTAFQDENIKGYYAMVITKLVDSKGNEYEDEAYNLYYSREDFEKLNYENFYNMAYSEPYRIFNESTSYVFHPVIYREMKDKYRNNLIHKQSKLESVTD